MYEVLRKPAMIAATLAMSMGTLMVEANSSDAAANHNNEEIVTHNIAQAALSECVNVTFTSKYLGEHQDPNNPHISLGTVQINVYPHLRNRSDNSNYEGLVSEVIAGNNKGEAVEGVDNNKVGVEYIDWNIADRTPVRQVVKTEIYDFRSGKPQSCPTMNLSFSPTNHHLTASIHR